MESDTVRQTLVFSKTNRAFFDAVAAGDKSVETRAATPLYSGIKSGDLLRLVCGQDEVIRRVVQVRHYDTVADLYASPSFGLTLPGVATLDEAESIYYSFPGYKAKISKYGIAAFELARN